MGEDKRHFQVKKWESHLIRLSFKLALKLAFKQSNKSMEGIPERRWVLGEARMGVLHLFWIMCAQRCKGWPAWFCPRIHLPSLALGSNTASPHHPILSLSIPLGPDPSRPVWEKSQREVLEIISIVCQVGLLLSSGNV